MQDVSQPKMTLRTAIAQFRRSVVSVATAARYILVVAVCLSLLNVSATAQQLKPAEIDFPEFGDLFPDLKPSSPSGIGGNSGSGPIRIPERNDNFLPQPNYGQPGTSSRQPYQPSAGSGVLRTYEDQETPARKPYQPYSDQPYSNSYLNSNPDASNRSNVPSTNLRGPVYDPIDGRIRQNFDDRLPASSDGSAINPQAAAPVKKGFDWTSHVTSVADLKFKTSNVFLHGDAFLTPAEKAAYLDLLDAIAERRRALVQQSVDEQSSSNVQVSRWEEAFYQFANARKLAWNNGKLRNREIPTELPGGLPDPFREAKPVATTADAADNAPFVMLDDIARFPEDYVGRPIILYGRFAAETVDRLVEDERPEASIAYQFKDQERSRQVSVLRGVLTSLETGRPIAQVDTQSLLTPQRDTISINDWPTSESSIPVVVKGWVVKKWDGRPLVYCESLRQISPNPHITMIRTGTIDKRRIADEEKWLYYETMEQVALNSPKLQQGIASSVLRQRIDDLLLQVNQKASLEVAQLTDKLQKGTITETTFNTQKTRIGRQLGQRVSRYRKYRKDPEQFQTYVDMFQNPDVWHGHLVTLHGHVRHVVSYPGDDMLYDGQMLHELWLFTDDSQHNPAVIVTPNLPRDFPLDAGVIDRVKVTGCFFKRYVYGSQDSDRIAPLILAGKVDWEPTIDQVQSLVKNGQLAADSPRAKRAAALSGSEIGNSAMIMICVFVLLVMMILWGRAQREERDRVRLRKRVNEVPEFENPALPDYPVGLSDLGTDYSREYRLS